VNQKIYQFFFIFQKFILLLRNKNQSINDKLSKKKDFRLTETIVKIPHLPIFWGLKKCIILQEKKFSKSFTCFKLKLYPNHSLQTCKFLNNRRRRRYICSTKVSSKFRNVNPEIDQHFLVCKTGALFKYVMRATKIGENLRFSSSFYLWICKKESLLQEKKSFSITHKLSHPNSPYSIHSIIQTITCYTPSTSTPTPVYPRFFLLWKRSKDLEKFEWYWKKKYWIRFWCYNTSKQTVSYRK